MLNAQSAFSSLWSNAFCLMLTYRKLGIHRRMDSASVLSIDTEPSRVRVTKSILSCPEYLAITRLYSRVRTKLKKLTLPAGLRSGMSRIPVSLASEVDAIIANAEDELRQLVDVFLAQYDKRIVEEESRLKAAYRTRDYPDPDTVRAAFGLTYSYITFDLPGTLETISATMLKREERRSMEKVNNMLEDVNTYLREAMRSLVNHLVDRLSPSESGKSKTFKSSTLTNLLEFLNTFDARNLGNDIELSQLVTTAKNVLSGVDSQLLRSDQSIANVVQNGMGTIKAQLDSLLIKKPIRLYSFDEAA